MKKLQVASSLSNEDAMTGAVHVYPQMYRAFFERNKQKKPVFVLIQREEDTSRKGIFRLEPFNPKKAEKEGYPQEVCTFSNFQREMMNLSKSDVVQVIHKHVVLSEVSIIGNIKIDLQVLVTTPGEAPGSMIEVHQDKLEEKVRAIIDRGIINLREPIFLQEGWIILGRVTELELLEKQLGVSTTMSQGTWGRFDDDTVFEFTSKDPRKLKILSDKLKTNQLFKQNFNFQEMGIGGLDKQFSNIFRRAFNSRRYPKSVLDMYGIKHVKGMLLHGPPGTGKTLIARQIAKALEAHEPKIVNGPQIFNKYVGQSEENVRKLFQQAETEYSHRGDESKLHTIILDEIDAICKPRGTHSSGTGVSDNVVNQLLAKIDGVNQLPNILIIGMTNRIDLIDQAVLRPGRLEVHIEISLPNEEGREQIFRIHTRSMKKNNLLSPDVNLKELARLSKNFSGAEIESVVKSATSFALFENAPQLQEQKAVKREETKFQKTIVNRGHFLKALDEIKPQFGVDEENLENNLRGGIISYGPRWEEILKTTSDFVNQVKESDATNLLSFLISGQNGSGKTALASLLATQSKFHYIKVISPDKYVGFSEQAKIAAIVKVFQDSYKSPLSLIIIDDIERLIEFIQFGPRFSNAILQALLVLINKHPPKLGHSLCIIGTTSRLEVLKQFEVVSAFNNLVVELPFINEASELQSVIGSMIPQRKLTEIKDALPFEGIGIKQLLLASKMALQKASEENKTEVDVAVLNDAIKRISRFKY